MIKLFSIFFFLILACQTAYANYFPSYTNSISHYGIGIINVNSDVNIYKDSSQDSEIIGYIKNSKEFSCSKQNLQKCTIEDTFVLYSKEKNAAFLSVEGDLDDWYYVCFDQNKRLFGYIKKSEEIDFFSWEQVINFYGRKYGVYLFRNLNDEYKKLHSSPDIESSIVDSFYIAKHITIWLLAKDWVLVKVYTYDGTTKTGWLRWKLDDGSLTLFPDFVQ